MCARIHVCSAKVYAGMYEHPRMCIAMWKQKHVTRKEREGRTVSERRVPVRLVYTYRQEERGLSGILSAKIHRHVSLANT